MSLQLLQKGFYFYVFISKFEHCFCLISKQYLLSCFCFCCFSLNVSRVFILFLYLSHNYNHFVFCLQNFCSRAALTVLGSCLNNKYAEGLPGQRSVVAFQLLSPIKYCEPYILPFENWLYQSRRNKIFETMFIRW